MSYTHGLRTALLASSAIAVAYANPAWAQSRDFDLPAQPASSGIAAFAEQADIQILVMESDTRGRQTSPVRGSMTPADGLQKLLAGTGLSVIAGDGTTFTVSAQDPQSGSAAGGGATVEALIVTAQKREEDIQDVPIAISAFTQEDLERSQIAGGPDLITQVPNMTFTKTNFSSYSVQLRGIGTQAISATTDPGVAVAFNNTPFIQNRFFEQEFYDLQRVEVLRGPQGTLYGRNATAGVVNIISQKPRFIFEAKASADVANYNSSRVEGMINIPLVEDAVALRLAGAWTKRDGYALNELNGNPIDGRDLWSTRVSLRISPSSAVDVNLIWEHFEEDDDRLRSGKQLCKRHVVTEVNGRPTPEFNTPLLDAGAPRDFGSVQSLMSQGCERESLYSPDSFQTPNGAMLPYYVPLGTIGLPITRYDPYVSTAQSRDLRVIESTIDPKYRAEADVGELQISWDVTDSLTLASETAYATDVVWSMQDFNRFNTLPGAWGTTGPGGVRLVNQGILSPDGFFCDPQLGCSDRLVAVDLSTADSRQFSQEFRVSSDFDGPFNFSLGANFLRFDLEAKYYVFFNSLTLSRVAFQGSFDSGEVPWIPGVSDNRECQLNGLLPGDPSGGGSYNCVYIEPNSIENIQDQGHNYFLSKNPYKLISYAVFGETYYNITDNLKVTGGLRYTVDKKEAPMVPSWTLAGHSRGYPVREVINLEWREPTGRLAIDWKPDLAFTDETMVYASYAHGYKAGGSNPPPMILLAGSNRFTVGGQSAGGHHASLTRPTTFDPEFIDAFELGAKNTLADGAVTLNLAGFYYDYTGYQISEIVDRSAFNRNFDAEVWGLEIEADWRPLENLKFGFKGGYENTRIKDGEAAIDLMDRTAGTPGWTIVRPFPTSASSCVLPAWLFNPGSGGQFPGTTGFLRGIGSVGGGGPGGCELAYNAHIDPMTGLEYVPFPTTSVGSGVTFFNWPRGEGTPGAYPGFNPLDESVFQHNNGEGFLKDLGGNELPNAPNFTATITADYTVPLAGDWLATLHTDIYWQSDSWWRVFNDHEFNRLDEYFTMNMAAIFTNEPQGWKVMAYVKNVFDRDSITGAFLNSDDTGLTTNVFLTEPRLYGLRVTKAWTGGPLLGSFGERRDGPYPFTLEIGRQVQRHDAPNDPLAPSFIGQFPDAIDPLPDQQDDLDWGDGREAKLTFRPNDSWQVSLGARFGKTNGSMPWSTRKEEGDRLCAAGYTVAPCQAGDSEYDIRYNYTISTTADREDHTLIDFMVGTDVGLGGLDKSTVAAGLRYGEFGSTTSAHIFGQTHWNIPIDAANVLKYPGKASFDRYESSLSARREFEGVGPVLSWEASKALLGNRGVGVLGLDWSVSGGVLFGDRNTSVEIGEEASEHHEFFLLEMKTGRPVVPTSQASVPAMSIARSESVTVPTYGASLGLSYKIDRFSIGTGYRWERYQGAIDGGFDEAQEEDRTIDGPYFKLSVGFGG